MSLIYWDTMLFIYALEGHDQRVRQILGRIEERKDTLCTSAFAIGETLAGPHKTKDHDIVERIRATLRPPFVSILDFKYDTADRYARIRVDLGVSPADAIHMRSGSQCRCFSHQ